MINRDIVVQRLDQICATSISGSAIADLSQLFQVKDFKLGDILGDRTSILDPHRTYELDTRYFYLICSGKVRILSCDPLRSKQVSVQLLKEGDIFGGDRYFDPVPLSYQAIAASSGQIARVAWETLQSKLEAYPSLQQQWLRTIQWRQRLIFFKTLTLLSPLPTRQLESFCPYVVEEQIPVGTNLQDLEWTKGRFWLRNGELQDHNVAPGFSWGYPESSVPSAVVTEALWVYHFPKQHWDDTASVTSRFDVIERPQAHSAAEASPTARVFPLAQSPVQTPTGTFPTRQTQAIDFPRPSRRQSFQPWKHYPFVEQQSSSDCGAACLAMISQFWGKRFSLNWLRELVGTGRMGVSLKSLAKTAEMLGYQARPVRASLNRLANHKNPWVAHWDADHFIVVYKVRRDRILVADPAQGKHRMSPAEFLAAWTGYALLLDPTEELYAIPGEKRSLGRFLNLLLPYRKLGLQIILASILIQVFGMVSPLFTQIILDQIVVSRSQETLNVMVLGALLFGVFGIGLGSIRSYLLSYLANQLDLTMISAFVKHTLILPLKFFEDRRVGDIITRVTENQKIQQFLVGQVLLSWLNLVSGFVYLCLMLYYNWQLTLLVLVIIPPIVILTLVATPLLRRISREQFNASADQNSALVELLTGISTVKTVAGEQELRWRWEDKLTKQLNVRFKGQKLAINLGLLSSLIDTIGGLCLLWFGASLVIQDQLTIGQFVAFTMMKGHVISPVISLVGLWDELQEILISVERLNDVFDSQPEEPIQAPRMRLDRIEGMVHFDNVTFRYDLEQERNTLQNLSFNVEPGQTLAIVGRSGSGKSTLVKLLQGLYQPTSGHIWIDGHDLQHLSLQSLREQMGIVPQECFLFSGTILDNITLYREPYVLEDVIEIAKVAEAHPFIQSMPLGYQTKVGEWGAMLSGGQRQRIAIARALLGNPPIIILDEATSSLDTESERRFQENLEHLTQDRTTFIIAHRLSTVRQADCILVLDQGSLVEKGTHEDLMAQRGLYYHLAQQQINLQ